MTTKAVKHRKDNKFHVVCESCGRDREIGKSKSYIVAAFGKICCGRHECIAALRKKCKEKAQLKNET